ncbi:hypothetical protein HGI30_11240 [Paenibacillus albicereus]|uniref:Uncharacterized protein n=1 Tax=Paenibacillus albicereus TaxID=2726185 RepID=A0A6H2GXI4_9BACL|nr:hypothetical protein [Paenibacillus albicereus]QJC52069.1 hypothetical protein HGI30_11240 [Paenibacillus albicereus]
MTTDPIRPAASPAASAEAAKPCFSCESQTPARGELICPDCRKETGLSDAHYYIKQYYYSR